jgi:arylsulfatase
VICALGDHNDGFAFYLVGGGPVATVVSGGVTSRVEAPAPLDAEVGRVGFHCGRGRLWLTADGEEVASATHAGMLMFPAVGTAAGGLLVGRDRGLAVSDDYEPPFTFSGSIRRVEFRSGTPRPAPVDDVMRAASAAD